MSDRDWQHAVLREIGVPESGLIAPGVPARAAPEGPAAIPAVLDGGSNGWYAQAPRPGTAQQWYETPAPSVVDELEGTVVDPLDRTVQDNTVHDRIVHSTPQARTNTEEFPRKTPADPDETRSDSNPFPSSTYIQPQPPTEDPPAHPWAPPTPAEAPSYIQPPYEEDPPSYIQPHTTAETPAHVQPPPAEDPPAHPWRPFTSTEAPTYIQPTAEEPPAQPHAAAETPTHIQPPQAEEPAARPWGPSNAAEAAANIQPPFTAEEPSPYVQPTVETPSHVPPPPVEEPSPHPWTPSTSAEAPTYIQPRAAAETAAHVQPPVEEPPAHSWGPSSAAEAPTYVQPPTAEAPAHVRPPPPEEPPAQAWGPSAAAEAPTYVQPSGPGQGDVEVHSGGVRALGPGVSPEELVGRRRHGDPMVRRMGQGVRRAVGAGGVRRADDLATRLARPVPSCRYIAVTSIRGGAGKTSVAALVARTLAQHRDDRVIIIDADAGLGSLPLRLGVRDGGSVADLAAAQPRTWDDTARHLARTDEGLWVLRGAAGGRLGDEMELETYQAAAGGLARYFSTAVVDCGAGIVGALTRGIIGTVHAQVFVTPGTADGALSALETLNWFAERGYGPLLARTVLALVTHTPHADADLSRARQLLSDRGMTVVDLPYDRHLASGTAIDPDRIGAGTRAAAGTLAAEVFTRSLMGGPR